MLLTLDFKMYNSAEQLRDYCSPSDQWKVSLVESGCVDHLLAITDEEIQQKAIDTIVLLLAEGSLIPN